MQSVGNETLTFNPSGDYFPVFLFVGIYITHLSAGIQFPTVISVISVSRYKGLPKFTNLNARNWKIVKLFLSELSDDQWYNPPHFLVPLYFSYLSTQDPKRFSIYTKNSLTEAPHVAICVRWQLFHCITFPSCVFTRINIYRVTLKKTHTQFTYVSHPLFQFSVIIAPAF